MPRVGCGGEQDGGLGQHLPPDDELLLVAAGEGLGGDIRAGGADVEAGDDLVGPPPRPLAVDPEAAGDRALRLMAEHDVLPQRRHEHEPIALAVLRDVPEAAGAAGLGAEAGGVAAVDLDAAGGQRLGAEQRAHQLGLAVALHTGDAHDLAPVHAERHVLEQGTSTFGPGDGEAVDGEGDLVGHRRVPRLRGRELAADHQLGQLAGGHRADVVDLGHRLAGADDGDGVGHAEHLVELVGDEDHGVAPRRELAQRREQLVDLLGDEHGGRLVEDDDAGAAVQHLEDLDPLALDRRRGRPMRASGDTSRPNSAERSPICLRALRMSSRTALPGSSPRTTFSQTVRLSASMKCWKTIPIPSSMASRGEWNWRSTPLTTMRAFIGPVRAVEGLHQRRLAGAVLAHDGVDGAGAHGEVDAVVGHDAREPLDDAAQLDGDRPVARRSWP